MYVTRPLSLYKKDKSALSLPPPEGPNSGYLVILDEEVEAEMVCCFGWCKDNRIRDLPFPQNKNLTVSYTTTRSTTDANGNLRTQRENYDNKVTFIPVLGQPLSANRYYVIPRQGKHQGKASTSSKEEDMGTCCCFKYVKDTKPKPLDPFDIYQQIEIFKSDNDKFSAKSVAPDGFPPLFLRRSGWSLHASTPKHYHLDEALGLNSSLRTHPPDFDFPLSKDCSESVIVGKWYCPFMFVKEELSSKKQMKLSEFYKMTLEQKWEKVISRENIGENVVVVDAFVQNEIVKIAGREAVWDERDVADGVLWFKSSDGIGGEIRAGLSLVVVERMKWEQERVGWVGGNETKVKLEKIEEFKGIGGWKSFGCYLLVESFVLGRMDGSVVLNYDFKHTHQIKCKWECTTQSG